MNFGISERKFSPPFIYRHHPEEGDEVKSGSGASQNSEEKPAEKPDDREARFLLAKIPQSACKPWTTSNEPGCTSPEEILQLFGVDPEVLAQIIGEGGKVVGFRDLVRRIDLDLFHQLIEKHGKTIEGTNTLIPIGTKNGVIFIKRGYLEMSADLDPSMKDDASLRYILQAFYTNILFTPEFYNYESSTKVATTITEEAKSRQDENFFFSIADDKDLAAAYSTLPLYFGMWDHSLDNVRKSEIKGQEDKIVLLDFGISTTDEPVIISYPKAKFLISTPQAPFVCIKGGNSIEPYKRFHEKFGVYLKTPEGKAKVIEARIKAGKTSKEAEQYYKTVLKNIEYYLENIDMFIAAANRTLPSINLNKFGFKGNVEKLKEVDITATKQELKLKSGEQLVYELGEGFLQIIERDESNNIKITNLFGKDDDGGKSFSVNPGQKVKIGKKTSLAENEKEDTNTLCLSSCQIRDNHIRITNKNNEEVIIEDLTFDKDDKFKTYLWF